ncbi:uncharacterized protein At5g01610 [Cucumis sativus]|uniref:DUF538 domain-containing protein n=1 Tax=Cucumis sativus TaxID=3659 RepID=A0A0A0K6Z0_CUCSA|nr:uncharacterized protein At5g01610 [Cucumis sativus]KGN44689.1 hypothetical protein Csa_016769 [Cucumis sativus]
MFPPFSILFLWFSFLYFTSSMADPHSLNSYYSRSNSFYDVLLSHGLPKGLLPKGITDYQIDADTGRFVVFLDRECNAMFENQLHYETNVSGTLSYGKIGALSGISAQDLFLWFPVKGIRVDVPSSGVIYFDVGVVFKQFSQSLFETPPVCVPNSKSQHRKIGNGNQFVKMA